MSRASETLSNIPLATLAIMAICIGTYILQLLFDQPLHLYTMCPRNVLYLNEYYRFITSSIHHGSLMHIGMNMMSTMAIGSMLERQIGTLTMGMTIAWGILLTSSIYVITAWMLHLIFDYEKLMIQHSVGFSGVIFQLSVLESNLNPNRMRNVFGFFTVSSKMYPWALLVILQFIMPQISFLGHLSGILVGTLQYYGCFDQLFPSNSYLQQCEGSERMASLRRQPSFVNTPDTRSWRRDGNGNNAGGVRMALLAAFASIALYARYICETIQVCIFGRGANANANIQLNELGAAWGSPSSGDAAPSSSSVATTGGAGTIQGNLEDDEEWVGLPAAIQRSTEEM